MDITQDSFRKEINRKQTGLHLLRNASGMKVWITNYGARFVSIIVPDANNQETDVVVGFDSIDGYLESREVYYSALVGRFANRVAKGKFSLNGRDYQLAVNNPPNHLHGGPAGFHNQVWEFRSGSERSVSLFHASPDGEEGYPGNLEVTVTYSLSDENELGIEYEAVTDAPTIINLTSHGFFNLNGQGSGTIEQHLLQVDADMYTPVGDSLIPRGVEPVEGTPFDFRRRRAIGERINESNDQLKFGNGYDHNVVLNGSGYRKVATVQGDRSGISMEVWTDQPGMQLYSGNYMKSENRIKYGMIDKFREAFCLETQHFPDSPNQPGFPSTVLNPGEIFRSRTAYKFATED